MEKFFREVRWAFIVMVAVVSVIMFGPVYATPLCPVEPCDNRPADPPPEECHRECQWGPLEGARCQKCCDVCGDEVKNCEVTQCDT